MTFQWKCQAVRNKFFKRASCESRWHKQVRRGRNQNSLDACEGRWTLLGSLPCFWSNNIKNKNPTTADFGLCFGAWQIFTKRRNWDSTNFWSSLRKLLLGERLSHLPAPNQTPKTSRSITGAGQALLSISWSTCFKQHHFQNTVCLTLSSIQKLTKDLL